MRRIARDVAMKIAFSRLLGGEGNATEVLEQSGNADTIDDVDAANINDIVQGVRRHEQMLDEHISRLAVNWKLDRLPKVDLCILRLAMYEMLYREDIPIGASINEAVELAKAYSGEKNAKYINGMLGTLARENIERT